MSVTFKVVGKALKKFVRKPVIVGYQVFSKAAELAQDYRVKEDKLSGQIVRELDALLQIDGSATEGKDYLYFSVHGLKGAAFAWNKAGNAMAFKINSGDSSRNGSSYAGRTFYLVTMFPIVIRPSSNVEILAHARSGKDNQKFFTAIFNGMMETSARMKTMRNPGPGLYLMP